MALEIISLVLIVVLIIVIYFYRKSMGENNRLNGIISGLNFDKKSLSVKYGKITEQFIPFMETYPYTKENFRFIGSPIDGIQFENDKIVFIEFKASDSRLSPGQERIKDIVRDKRVEFREIKIR